MFASNDAEKEIAVEDLDPAALESLLHFAYTNTVDISAANVKSLLVTSEFLQLGKVRDACIEFLSQRQRVDNIISIRKFADSLDNRQLIENCNLFIFANFVEFSKCVDFLSLSHSCIKEILSSDELNVSNEEIVFEALMRWVKNSPSERRVALPELLREVRMKYLPVSYLLERIDTEELIVSSNPCGELVNEVKHFHLLPNKSEALSTLNVPPCNVLKQGLYGICSCGTCGITVHRFDAAEEKWQSLAFNQTEHGVIYNVAAVDGKIYMFHDETVQILSLKSLKWEAFKCLSKGVNGAAVVSHGNKIYCLSPSEYLTSQVWCFDTQQTKWMRTGHINPAWRQHSAVSLGDCIYVGGGMRERGYAENTVKKYNPLTAKCSNVAPMLTARYNHGSTSMNGKIFVCGGDSKDSGKIASEVYDPLTDQWNRISTLNVSQLGCRLVSYCSKIYAFRESDEHAEIYDPRGGEWKGNISLPGGFKFALSIPVASIQNGSD